MAIEIGAPAPNATLTAQDGSGRTIPERGVPNLLVFNRGDW